MNDPPRIDQLLACAGAELAQVGDAPRLEAEVLLAHVLGKPRSYLYAWPEKTPTRTEFAEYRALIARRQAGEPVAYMLGVREFFGREFCVSPDVLIPRPETELLVELALERIPPDRSVTVVDLGVGSGAIAVSIALERPRARVVASDISPAALRVAQANAARLNAVNVAFALSDWFDGLPYRPFDLILGNPPYIVADDPHLKQGDLRFEPQTALASGPDGLDDIRRIVASAYRRLTPEGWLLLEHGYDQADAVQTLMRSSGYTQVASHADLAGHPRVTLARRPVE